MTDAHPDVERAVRREMSHRLAHSTGRGGAPLVCFDLDGCLVDSRVPIAAAMNHALVAVGAPPRDEVDLHARIGPPLLGAFEEMLVEAGHDRTRGRDAVAAYRAVYGDLAVAHTTAVPGMAEVLSALHAAGAPMLVVTTKPAEFATPILHAVGMHHWFGGVFAPALTALEEPKADTLVRALAHAGVEGASARAQVTMVGDRHHDIDAGRARGTRTIGVTWGSGSRDELVAAGADAVVATPAALAARLGI